MSGDRLPALLRHGAGRAGAALVPDVPVDRARPGSRPVLTFGLAIGAGLAAAVAAVWPRRARTVTTASPARHRAADAHTGSLSATRLLDRMNQGQDPLR